MEKDSNLLLKKWNIPGIKRFIIFGLLSTVLATLLIGFTEIAGFFDILVMIPSFAVWLLVLMAAYMILAQILKAIYIRINKEWV